MGDKAKLKLTPTIIIPSRGDLYMRCGDCGEMKFGGHIRPHPGGAGRLVDLICAKCLKVYKLDEQGFLEGGGKIDPLPKNNAAQPNNGRLS